MLDLQPIKSRLAATTPGRWYREVTGVAHRGIRTEKAWLFADDGATEADSELVACAKEDLAALVAEVERLREAIQSHLETYAAERTDNYEASSTALYESYLKLWDAFDA